MTRPRTDARLFRIPDWRHLIDRHGKTATGLAACAALLGTLFFLGFNAYHATPPTARDARLWDGTTFERTASFCNAAPYPISVTVAYPGHHRQWGLDRLSDKEWAAFGLMGLDPSGRVRHLFDKAVLGHARDYDELIVESTKRLSPGECHDVAAQFRRGRERFFAAARMDDPRTADVVRAELFIQLNEPLPAPTVDTVGRHLRAQTPAIFTAELKQARYTKQIIPRCLLADNAEEAWRPLEVTVSDAEPQLEFVGGDRTPPISLSSGFICAEPVLPGHYRTTFEDRDFPLLARDGSPLERHNEALRRALSLANGLKRLQQDRAKAQEAESQFRQLLQRLETLPYWFAEVRDDNGRMRPGVRVEWVPDTDIYGEPIKLPRNALITHINNRPVFSVAEMLLYIYQHADSYNGGIDRQFSITYFDGKFLRETKGRHFFNQEYFTGDWSSTATWHGVISAGGIIPSASATCAIKAMRGEMRYPDGGNMDFGTCRWIEIQRKGMARQLASDSYRGGQILSGGVVALSRRTLGAFLLGELLRAEEASVSSGKVHFSQETPFSASVRGMLERGPAAPAVDPAAAPAIELLDETR